MDSIFFKRTMVTLEGSGNEFSLRGTEGNKPKKRNDIVIGNTLLQLIYTHIPPNKSTARHISPESVHKSNLLST